MVEKGRNGSNQKSNTLGRISEIIDFYTKDYEKIEGHKVEIYSAIVDALNRLDTEKKWTWKYLSNVEKKHIKPGKRFAVAIDILWRMIKQKPVYASAPVCSRCGAVHTTKRCTANDAPKRKPPWYKREDSYPDDERWRKVLGGWK